MKAVSLSVLGFCVALAAGCGSDDGADFARLQCAGKSGVSGHSIREIESDGRTRSFRLAVPSSYDGTRPVPLVFDFHGVLSNAEEQEARSQLTETGEANEFIVVTPDGFEKSWNAEVCCSQALAQNVNDVQFARDMVATLEQEFCIDERRIYAGGYSNGGLMADVLACRAADLFAAVAVIEAAALDASTCAPSRPVPIMFVNGTADFVVPYSLAGPSVATWRQINQCGEASEITFDQGDTSCESWSDCADGSATLFCTVEGGGHVWPGGGFFPDFLGHKSVDFSTSDEMWKFFEEHPLR